MLLSFLLVENTQDQITSVLFPLIYKTDFKMTAYRNNYAADLTTTKICNTEVNLLIGAMGLICDYLPPQHLFSVSKG